MSELLDPETAAALDRAGMRVRAFRRLSKVPASNARRAVYRIDLEPGSVIKARRLEDDETAQRLFEVRRLLPDAFAPAFARYGAVLLEDWIDGDALGDTPPSAAHLVDAGSLLAQLHATPTVNGLTVHEMRGTAAWRAEADAALREILAAGALDEGDVQLIGAALERLDPEQAIFGLIHTDFCGENMVVDRSGQLRVIDNERIGIDALGFDLARTWYRWALPASSWGRLRAAYAGRAPFAEPLDTFDFWSLVAVAHSAALRVRTDQARAHVPLDRLRRMAAAHRERQTPYRGRR